MWIPQILAISSAPSLAVGRWLTWLRFLSAARAQSAVLLLISFVTLLNGCSSQPSAVEMIPLDVCLSSTNMNRASADYALDKGLFAKYGLDVHLVGIDGGPNATRALLSKQMDLCHISGPAVVNAALAGADLAVIGGIINRQLYSFMVTPDIETAADLKGKSLAVSEPGSASDSILRLALQSLGLEPDKDVTIVSIGGNAARLAALEARSVAGTMISVPESGRAKALGLKALLDPNDLEVPYQHTAVVLNKAFLEENRPTVTNYIKALSEATFLMKQDREGTLDLMSGILLFDPEADRDVLDEAFDVIILENMDERLPVNRAGIQWLIEAGSLENPGAIELAVDDIVDESITKSLAETGYFDQLGK